MTAHLKYLRSVLLHKWYVAFAGLRLGVPWWALLVHDWSKFTPAEWGPYARRFGRGTGGALIHSTEPVEWQIAWNHHQKAHPHHWNYWVLITDQPDARLVPLPMPERYVREMVADWAGASRGYTGSWDIGPWYAKNSAKFLLHDETRALVERVLAEWNATL